MVKEEERYIHSLGLKYIFQNRFRLQNWRRRGCSSMSFIHSLHRYLSNTSCVPAAVLSAEDVVNKAEQNL